MSMGLRYQYGFYSYSNVLYEVSIYQEGYSGDVIPIEFGSESLTIEWHETDKLEPVQSSVATLCLFSNTDRQFVDLYTVKAGSVRLDVYRDGSLYWSGTLDPELYEEPFAYESGYEVKLTFSDLAILDRLSFSGEGFKTLREMITEALSAAGINYGSIEEHISTSRYTSSQEDLLGIISVQSQNFYDEDGESMTIREVLDETLRPFALRLIQKAGQVYLYDLNALYAAFTPKAVEWDGDDSTLSADKVYNNVKLTFSPYEQTTLLKGEVDVDSVSGQQVTIWFASQTNNADEIGFYTHLSDTAKGLEKNTQAKFFRIEPYYSGEEEAGVAWTLETTTGRNVPTLEESSWRSYIQQPSSQIGSMLLRVPHTPYLAYAGLSNRDYRLKVSLQVLFDPRLNPFEEASLNNEEGNWEEQQDWANFAYVPIKLTLRDEDGTALYHYYNNLVKESDSFANPGQKAYWRTGEASWGDAWLCWYQGNRQNESGLGGWQQNKQIIGYYRDALPELFDKRGTGELINLPGAAGYLEMQIGTGIVIYDYEREVKQGVYDQCRWLFYKEPTIEFVQKTGNSIQTKDVELSAWLNRDAKEPLDIDIVLGTLEDPSPAALGQLYLTQNHTVVNSFSRAGVTDLLEKLLIGTVYTQYATPHKVLSGTTKLLPSFATYTDAHEPGTYLLLSETQNLRAEQSQIKMVQFEADDYEGIEYEE